MLCVPTNWRMQSLKIDTLPSNMPDNGIRAARTFNTKFNTLIGQLNFQLRQSAQGCYESRVCSGRMFATFDLKIVNFSHLFNPCCTAGLQ